METMAISKFKATCLSVMKRVNRTRKPVRITKFGKAIADVVPPAPDLPKKDWMGCMAGTVQFMGDIVSPATDPDDWEALRD